MIKLLLSEILSNLVGKTILFKVSKTPSLLSFITLIIALLT